MKRLMFICLAALFTTNIIANSVIPEDAEEVQIVGPVIREGGHKSPALHPSIFYLENYLYISSSYYIDEAQIIIRDEDGTIIYNTVSSLVSGVSVFILPQDVADDMYSIEFIYGDHDLFGFF